LLDLKGILSPVLRECHGPLAKEGKFYVSERWKKSPTLFVVVLFFIFGDSSAPEFHVPTFRNTLSVPSL